MTGNLRLRDIPLIIIYFIYAKVYEYFKGRGKG